MSARARRVLRSSSSEAARRLFPPVPDKKGLLAALIDRAGDMDLQKLKVLLSVLAAFSLAGCVTAGSAQDPMAEQATMVPATKTGLVLDDLPPPQQKLDVAVYAFPDLTGQN